MIQISDRAWIYPYEEERDRPTLSYVRGEDFSVAVDAGHSAAHVREFYRALLAQDLPLPAYTVVTHWHWDHTFGMHAVHGLTVAEERTNEILARLAERISPQVITPCQRKLMETDPHVALEYAAQPMQVVTADRVFKDSVEMDAGGVHVQFLHVPSPHTEDSVVILAKETDPEGRGILFVGDAPSGAYPHYDVRDPEKLRELKKALEPLSFDTVIGGHWPVETREEFLKGRCADPAPEGT